MTLAAAPPPPTRPRAASTPLASVLLGGGGGREPLRPPQQAWNPVGRKRSERPPSSGRGGPRPPPRSRFTSAPLRATSFGAEASVGSETSFEAGAESRNEIDQIGSRCTGWSVRTTATDCPRPAKRERVRARGPALLRRRPLSRRPSAGDLSPPSPHDSSDLERDLSGAALRSLHGSCRCGPPPRWGPLSGRGHAVSARARRASGSQVALARDRGPHRVPSPPRHPLRSLRTADRSTRSLLSASDATMTTIGRQHRWRAASGTGDAEGGDPMGFFGAGKCHLPMEWLPSKAARGCPGLAEKSQRGGVPQRQDPFRESHATPLRSDES
jgi:hypothetical protein